jgi:hypothetical protein
MTIARRTGHFERGLDDQIESMLQDLKSIESGAVYAAIIEAATQAAFDAVNPVGKVEVWTSSTLPARGTWLWMDDRTIGDASSNGTSRANADTYDLFVHLWTNFDNTASPIYTSAGAGSTRGASAAADWAAHKAVTIAPINRGRAFCGMDDYGKGGSGAGTITAAWADNHGRVGGAENHVLTSAQNGTHKHLECDYYPDPTTIANISNGTVSAGSGNRHNGSDSGARMQIYTENSGSGQAHNNIQPTTAIRYIIRCV